MAGGGGVSQAGRIGQVKGGIGQVKGGISQAGRISQVGGGISQVKGGISQVWGDGPGMGRWARCGGAR